MKLVAPSRKAITLRPVRPSAALRSKYAGQLLRLVDAMNKSIMRFVVAAYRAKPPHAAQAMDASPASTMQSVMNKLSRQWKRNFSDASTDMARGFANGALTHGDRQFQMILKKAGFSVKFQGSRYLNDAFQAVVHENVNLIKSIAAEHLDDVQGLVMRSVQKGRNLSELRDQLQERFGVTRRRAEFIARDQNNKATALLHRVRQKQAGLNKAMWNHTSASVHPRLSHIDADGKTYDLDKGLLIDGDYIFPGELPNCGCTGSPIIPGYDDED